VQFSTALYIFSQRPSADRIDNVLTGTQFFAEGCQTLSLFMASEVLSDLATAQTIQLAAFFLGMVAVFLPLVEKVYDAVVVQVSRCCRGEFTLTGFFFAFVALALSLPSVLLSKSNGFGDETAGHANDAASILDEGNNAVKMTVSDNMGADSSLFDGMAELMPDVADAMADLPHDMFWMHGSPTPGRHRGSVSPGRRFRSGINFLPVEYKAATSIQRQARVRWSWRLFSSQEHKAAVEIQRQARRRWNWTSVQTIAAAASPADVLAAAASPADPLAAAAPASELPVSAVQANLLREKEATANSGET
jgi:hypothetical protein